MKRLIISLLVAFFVLSLLGSAIAAPAIKTSDMEIIFIVKASESDFWQIVNDGGRKAAKHFGVKINFQAPTSEADVAKQISILEIAISMKPDAIVLAPTLADALVPGIEKGTASGVPIILIDSAANTDNYTSFLASDNYAIGAMAADMMAEALIKEKGKAEGKVACIEFMAGVGSLEKRKKGFLDTMVEKYPDIKLLPFQDAQGKQGITLAVTQNILTANPDLDGFFASNQYTGDELVRTLDTQKRKDLAVVVVDSGEQELWGLENGYVDYMVVQKPWNMGYDGIAYAIMAINGVPIPKFVDTGIVAITYEMLKSGAADEFLRPVKFHKDW